MNRTLTTTFLILTGALAAQDRITILEGASTGSLSLRVFDESRPTTAGSVFLSGLQILPIEMTNRTVQETFRPGRPHRVTRQGLVRIELPDGGQVFRYRRGGNRFGFVLVQASGAPLVLQELPGVGASGQDDPYEDRIGVAIDGGHASLATKAGALWIVRLDGKTFTSTRTPARRLTLPNGVALEPIGVALGKTHGFFVTDDDRVRRCALADGNQPTDVTPSGTNLRLKDEFAMSGDGNTVAFLFGPKDRYSIYLLRTTGGAIKLSPPPAKYEEPGYLPENVGGPRMLLNGDGSRLMYTDATIRDEIFLLDTAGKEGTTHVTSDANFRPYIGVGILPAFAVNTLVLAVGNPNAHDWFAATSKSRVVANITQTGPQKQPPFDVGQLDPQFGFLAPNGLALSTEKLANGTTRVRLVDPARRTSRILVASLRARPELGARLGGAPSVLLPGHAADSLLSLDPKVPTVSVPGAVLTTDIGGLGGLFRVGAARHAATPTSPWLPWIQVHGVGMLFLPLDRDLRQMVLTRSGGAVLNSKTTRYLAPGIDVALRTAGAIRIVLSGASN